jgi:hypothetical protein
LLHHTADNAPAKPVNISDLFGGGAANAVAGLSQMVGKEIQVVGLQVKKVLVKDGKNNGCGRRNVYA